MSKILSEIREISSKKIAEKQKTSENNYPKLIERIKAAAALGVTDCEFNEREIDQYSKRLLEQDGFNVYATTRQRKSFDYYQQREPVSVWVVTW